MGHLFQNEWNRIFPNESNHIRGSATSGKHLHLYVREPKANINYSTIVKHTNEIQLKFLKITYAVYYDWGMIRIILHLTDSAVLNY